MLDIVGRRPKILISGASVAGLTLAYWLNRFEIDVTVVERACGVRSGGYPIDVRGSAVGVLEKMGLLDAVRAKHIDSRAVTFVDHEGEVIGSIPPYVAMGNDTGRDVELPRGELTELLYGLVRETEIEFRFNSSVSSLVDEGSHVLVQFDNGLRECFDVVIGADGLHSWTRRLTFGDEEQFNRFMGYQFCIFSVPNELGLAHETITYSDPGRTAGLLAVRNSPETFAFLIYSAEKPSPSIKDEGAERAGATAVYAGAPWVIPSMLESMSSAKDLYCDTVSQIRMSNWSTGRVGLVGDAAYAPSFLSGQGTSLALAGAYVLAGELASKTDPVAAFREYERIFRPFAEANQALAEDDASRALFFPRTTEDVAQRDAMLGLFESGRELEAGGDAAAEAYNLLQLPEYDLVSSDDDASSSQ